MNIDIAALKVLEADKNIPFDALIETILFVWVLGPDRMWR